MQLGETNTHTSLDALFRNPEHIESVLALNLHHPVTLAPENQKTAGLHCFGHTDETPQR